MGGRREDSWSEEEKAQRPFNSGGRGLKGYSAEAGDQLFTVSGEDRTKGNALGLPQE